MSKRNIISQHLGNDRSICKASGPLLLSKLLVLPESLNLQLLAGRPTVHVSHVVWEMMLVMGQVRERYGRLTGCGLEVGCGIVALGDENVVLLAALQRLVDRDRGTHELLLDLAQALKARLEFNVVIGILLGNGRDDGNVVALGADVVSG